MGFSGELHRISLCCLIKSLQLKLFKSPSVLAGRFSNRPLHSRIGQSRSAGRSGPKKGALSEIARAGQSFFDRVRTGVILSSN